MNQPDPFATGGRPSPTYRSELQGPRPTPLKVNKDSHKIKKPPVAPHFHHHQPPQPHHLHPPPTAAFTTTQTHNPQPVIIYAVSPKVLHTTVSDFMNLVQRLTGPSGDNSSAAADRPGDVSPAARYASIERTSPKVAAATSLVDADNDDADDFLRILEENGVEIRHNFPGILSPAPAMMPPITPSGIFTPTMDHLMQMSNMFVPSPSPMASPSLASYFDLYNRFVDF